jgi:hypothetical protein
VSSSAFACAAPSTTPSPSATNCWPGVKRDELLARRQAERKKVTAGVYGKTMAELLDRYFAIWQKTPRKGHLPAKITVYHRNLLIEQVVKPAFGHRIPGQIQPGEIADWYDELTEDGYTDPEDCP